MDKDNKWQASHVGQVSKWDNIQSDKFTLWANHHLQKKGLAIKDLADFSDGVLLLNLLEVVSNKNVPRYIKNPKFLHHKIENITVALGFMEKALDIKVLGCNAKDIADGNLKQILGIIFMLIQKSKDSGDESTGPATEIEKPKSSGLARSQSQNQIGQDKSSPRGSQATSSGAGHTATSASAKKPEPAEPKAKPKEPTHTSTGIPVTVDAAPFTPSKVHRPRPLGDINNSTAPRPVAKGSFLAKQEFFERKDQESREQQERLRPRHQHMMSPTREFGLPVLVLSARREDGGESPREAGVSPPDSARDTRASPREPAKPNAPAKPMISKASPRAAEPTAQPDKKEPVHSESKQAKPEPEPTKAAEPTPAQEPTLQITPSEPAPEPTSEPAEPATAEPAPEPEEAKTEPTPEPAKEEEKIPEPPTPEQQRELEKQRKRESKDNKRLSKLKQDKRLSRKDSDETASREEEEEDGEDEEARASEEAAAAAAAQAAQDAAEAQAMAHLKIPEEVAVLFQTLIRASMCRIGYSHALERIARRKRELLDEISTNPKMVRGMLRVQAAVRGRITRIRVRREAQVYRRNEIAKEILTTEKKYVQNLDILVDRYLEPLKKMLLPQQIRNIFSNVEVIRSYNKTLLSRLEERMAVWYSKGQRLGDIFLEMTEFLKVYTMYVNNYNTSIATMTECMDNSKFASFVEKMRVAPECNGLSFASFLIQPIQRLPRYVLLLQDLVKHTPNKHADYTDLTKALKKMKDVADYVNERKREAENLTQVLAIQSKLTGKFENLAEPHRRYVRRGSLAMFDEKGNIRSFFYFLFNDMLVYTENKSQSRLFRGSFGKHLQSYDEAAFNSGKFKFIGRLPLQGLGAGVADVPDTEKDKVMFAFQLITPTTSTLLMANSQDDKVAWMNDLDECIYALLEKERSRKIGQFSEDHSSWHTKVTINAALEDGDYTGYIYKKANDNTWKQKYFLLRNGLLYYFPEKPPADTKQEHSARVINLVWCSVKVAQVLDRAAVFQLATPARIIFLSSPDLRTMFQWIYVIRLAIAGQIQALGGEEELGADPTLERFEPLLEPPNSPTLSSSVGISNSGNYLMGASKDGANPSGNGNGAVSALQEVLRQPANKTCADCGEPDPSWVSTTLGVFLCLECSGIHRRVLPGGAAGLHSIRSIANRIEANDLKTLGNAVNNPKYEKNLPPEMSRPIDSDPYDRKVEYIKQKYSSVTPSSTDLSVTSTSSGTDSPPTPRSETPPLGHSSSGSNLSPSLLSSSPTSSSTTDSGGIKRPERRNSGIGLDKALCKNKEGQLYKRQGALLQDDWKLYRFVLKEDHISYFKNKQLKGTIDLMLCSVKEGEVFAGGSDRPKYSFEIVAPTRIYMLAAETTQARDDWVHAINVCIATMMK